MIRLDDRIYRPDIGGDMGCVNRVSVVWRGTKYIVVVISNRSHAFKRLAINIDSSVTGKIS